ncbi:peptidoglycan-binding domain-containing protein [Hamadaea tsunoensis]|uniref:peptidoglycan-binding domain-containing protein n=1 Tax=Hamadaea tsunoensis TaxID=53368 RepID=UPI0004290037|nr:peptidoglycan-binding domain-containing protein [Hamadaea tsunoensis]
MLLVAAGALVFGSPAYAATPRCNNFGQWSDLRDPPQVDLYMAGYWPASNWNDATFKCLMSSGDSGDDVKELQRGLNLCYGSSSGVNLGVKLTVDGQFGPATKSALIKAQRYHKLLADGVYAPQTAAATWHRGHMLTPYGWYWTCTLASTLGWR